MPQARVKFIERNKSELEKSINTDPSDPHRYIDLSAEAQLMRYTAGAGLEINFNPFTGNLFDQRDKNWPKRLRRDAWIFSLDYGRLMGDPKALKVGELLSEHASQTLHGAMVRR